MEGEWLAADRRGEYRCLGEIRLMCWAGARITYPLQPGRSILGPQGGARCWLFLVLWEERHSQSGIEEGEGLRWGFVSCAHDGERLSTYNMVYHFPVGDLRVKNTRV